MFQGIASMMVAQGTTGAAPSGVVSIAITFNNTDGSKTATGTPVVNDLIIVVCAAGGTSLANAATTSVTDNNPDGLGTYTKVVERNANGVVPVGNIWVRDHLIGNASSTIFSAAQAAATGGGLEVFRITGVTKVGLTAIRQSNIHSGGAVSTPVVTYSGASLTANPNICAVVNVSNPAAMTQPGTFTESNDVGYASPNTGLETAFIDTGFTGTTITWGSISATGHGELAVEIDRSP